MNATERMGARHGTQAGDPVKGARAMYELAMMKDPPLRCVIGSDAVRVHVHMMDTVQTPFPSPSLCSTKKKRDIQHSSLSPLPLPRDLYR